MLCGLDIPTLFVDSPVADLDNPIKSDCLYMDNQTDIGCFVREMIRRGKETNRIYRRHLALPVFS